MKEDMLTAINSILLLYCTLSLLVIFNGVYAGGITLIEPNRAWLIAEMAMCCCFMGIAVGTFCYMIYRVLSRLKGVDDAD